MTHRFPIKEIARQAGLGTATVDRVLNNRAHVAAQTRARVTAAIDELAAQEQQLSARGRRMFVDVVVEAPQRFSRQVRTACESVLNQIPEAVYRPRFLMQEVMEEAEVTAALSRIRKRGSQGVILKARDTASIRMAVEELSTAQIPVVTLVTDLQTPHRCAYAGMDNAQAGHTAAFLLAQFQGDMPGGILTTRSQEDFQGETERFESFRDTYRLLRPQDQMFAVAGGGGLSYETRQSLTAVLGERTAIAGVYSMGGGNKAILDVLAAEGHQPAHYVAHDLDAENTELLRQGMISAILHHDLTQDMRHAFAAISAWHGLRPADAAPVALSDVQIITRYNIPKGIR
ncbi:MAG: LacI family DNA-binding transcriptional regulator [Pseudomonadota bacterium]